MVKIDGTLLDFERRMQTADQVKFIPEIFNTKLELIIPAYRE